MFTCPRCRTKLTTLRRREGLSWICVDCDGRAVNTATLSRTVSREFTASLWTHATAEPLPSALRCPACNGRMCATEIQAGEDRVILDLCRPCRLIWFDGGEMEIVREPLTAPSGAQSTAQTRPRGARRWRVGRSVLRLELAPEIGRASCRERV